MIASRYRTILTNHKRGEGGGRRGGIHHLFIDEELGKFYQANTALSCCAIIQCHPSQPDDIHELNLQQSEEVSATAYISDDDETGNSCTIVGLMVK